MKKQTLRAIFNKNKTSGDFFRQYSQYLFNMTANLDFEIIGNVARLILKKSKEGKTVYLIGNGGSAATASHFATDLSHCGLIEHKPLIRSMSLTDNVALLTALGNDKGYENIFTHQIKSLFQEGDILISISASGNSANIISAVEMAKKMGGVTVGMAGFDGGKLGEICDYTIHIKSEKGEYGPIEDIHLFLGHMISSYLGIYISEKGGNSKVT